MKHLFIVTLCFILIVGACKTAKFTPSSYEKEQIVFGNGGGFSGAVVEYTLLSNGQLFKKNNTNNDQVEIGMIKKNETAQIFEIYKLLKMDKRILNDPGNMYYFIKRKTPDTFHKAIWGGSQNVDSRVTIFFANLMKMVKMQREEKAIVGKKVPQKS